MRWLSSDLTDFDLSSNGCSLGNPLASRTRALNCSVLSFECPFFFRFIIATVLGFLCLTLWVGIKY